MITVSCTKADREERKAVIVKEIIAMNAYLMEELNMAPMMKHEAAMLQEYLMAKLEGKIRDTNDQDETQSKVDGP